MCKCSELARPITCQETTGNQPSRPGEFNNEFVRPINDENSAEHYICNGVLSADFWKLSNQRPVIVWNLSGGDQRLVRNCESHKFKLILFGARPDQRFICKCVETPKCNRWTNGRINTGTKTANYMFLTTLLVEKKYSLCRSHTCLAVEGRTMTYQHTSRHRRYGLCNNWLSISLKVKINLIQGSPANLWKLFDQPETSKRLKIIRAWPTFIQDWGVA